MDSPKQALKVFFLYSIRVLIPFLPRYWVMRLADLTGSLDSHGEKARITARELSRMLGPTASPGQVREIAKASLREFHKDLFEIWTFPRLNPRRMAAMASLEGRRHLDEALAQGKGAIIGVTHFGSWKVLIPALAYAGYKVHQVAVDPLDFDQQGDTTINNLIMRIERACEESLPVNFIYIGSFLREMYRALDRNEVVIISLDGIERRKQTPIKLLNYESGLDLTPLLLSIRKGVPFLPTFPLRGQDDRHRVVIHPALRPDPALGQEEAARGMAQAYARLMEGHIREHPSHYARSLYVFATRWKDFVDHPG